MAVYYILPHVLRNAFLLIASYYFYMQTVPVFAVYIAASTLLTYGSALLSRKPGFSSKLKEVNNSVSFSESVSGQPKKKKVFSAAAGTFVEVDAEPVTKPTKDSAKNSSGSGRGLKIMLLVTVLLNLSFLLVFKYAAFFADIINPLFTVIGLSFTVPRLDLIAPLGISFYTFQSLGYIIDVYRNKVEPERNPINYAVFISFFPQILSGPIGRSNQLLPQFKKRHPIKYQNLLFGAQRFMWGLFKKAVLADWLGLVVDGIYGNVRNNVGLPLLAAAVLYGLFIYLDFSAYCDMALGAAKMLGFDLLENFQAPYFATNMSGFWRRWHMSLTFWLTDYIFTPLVWSRWVNKLAFGKKWQDHAPHFAANIIIVFLISGLWHGASINFLIWGGLHGIFRVGEELLHKIRKPGKIKSKLLLTVVNPFKRLIVFSLACFAHIFFKLPTTAEAVFVIKNMFKPTELMEFVATVYRLIYLNIASGVEFIDVMLYVIGGGLLLVMLCDYFVIYRAKKSRSNPGNVLQHLPFLLRWPVYLFIVAAIIAFGYFGSSAFVYFQF